MGERMATASLQARNLERQRTAQGCTILLVDDSPTQVKRLEHLLRAEGYRVLICRDAGEALAGIDVTEPDLVISDVVMPGMDGFELCRRIRGLKEASQLPIILLTHLNDPTHVLRSLEAGANYFISKPYHNGILLSRVAAALRRDQGGCIAESDGTVSCNYYGNRYAIAASKP